MNNISFPISDRIVTTILSNNMFYDAVKSDICNMVRKNIFQCAMEDVRAFSLGTVVSSSINTNTTNTAIFEEHK